ncbi:MFS transporter [Dactylosporangium roseum]|uniref:MFS transporter n=1 Tax=Dactylosporangium roseum TaxID=47989 RepID=A0ABY5ZEE0_9ACTN|nr:MFS transporter [Dactylosporangium roseum]UWZ39117.1 MFS transporter [Dactylosporangium roseum]
MSDVDHQSTTTATPAPDPRRWRALAVLALVQFMIVVDNTIVNVALPSIRAEFNASTSSLTWVVNGYVLTAAGLLLLGGRLGDLFGRRRLFTIGTALFAVASLTAGAAMSLGMLVTGRFVQGVGEALAAPAALSLVALLFADERERARAFAIWGGIAGAGATLGVVLSGIITEFIDWRWIFFVNIPLALVPLLLIRRLVDEGRATGAPKRLDVPGAVLVTGGLVALVHTVVAAAGNGWGDPVVWAPLVAGVAALAAFVVIERRSAAPLVPPRFFTNGVRLSGNALSILLVSTTSAVFFLVILYMQDVLGYSPLIAGLAWVPFLAMFMPGLALSAKLVARLGVGITMAIGFAAAAAGLLLLSRIPADGSYVVDLLPAFLLISLGMGITNPALQNAVLYKVSGEDAGLGSGVAATVAQMGGALGVAVFATIAVREQSASTASPEAAATEGYRLALLVAGLVLVVGVLAAAWLAIRAPHVGRASSVDAPGEASTSDTASSTSDGDRVRSGATTESSGTRATPARP